MIREHLPILQVILPLVAAPLCVLLRRKNLVWPFALLVTWASCAVSIMLLQEVMKVGTLTYALGNWSAPLGIVYHIDAVNVIILVIITSIASIVMLFAPNSVAKEINEAHTHLFYAAFLLCMTGLLGITCTGDAFNVFVFLEISSLSSYALISLGKDRRALSAAFQYLVMGTIGGTFILIGIGLIYMKTGTLNMADLAVRLKPIYHSRTVLIAYAFLVVGMSIKLALFPLHLWLPNAYTFAPSIITAFLAATATKVSFYMLLRFSFSIFGLSFVDEVLQHGLVLTTIALAAVFAGSIVAIFQTNIKRMLAYSSIAQIGYMVLGASLFTVDGMTGGILHMFNHAIMKGALFLSLACVMWRVGSVQLDDFKGLGRRMPITMFAFVIGGLSLIGVPLTAGFVSKWQLLTAIVGKGYWIIAGMVVLSSLLAVIYIWRVIEVAYFQEEEGADIKVEEAPWGMLIPMWILVGANIYFGIANQTMVDVARQAAKLLLGVSS